MIKTSAAQCSKEEYVNTITHGFGLALAVIGSIIMSYFSIKNGNIWHIAGGTIFSLSMIVLYASSTLFHHAKCEKRKSWLNMMDHSAIYIFIAGSYTLVLLTLLNGPQAQLILVLQWTIAILGTIYKFKVGAKSGVVDSLVYLLMGWMIVFFYEQLQLLPDLAFNLILAGGICYTIGVVFFLMDHKVRYFHAIWHFFVLSGTILHYLVGVIYIS